MEPRQDNDELRRHNMAVAQKALEGAIREDGLDEIYAPDCEFHQPFFFPDRVTYVNPSTEGDLLSHEETVGIFHQWNYTPGSQQIYTTQDPNCIIITNSGTGTVMRRDGKDYPYQNSYVHIFHFTDGKISCYYEYANPLALLDAMGIDHPPLPTPEETTAEYQALGLL